MREGLRPSQAWRKSAFRTGAFRRDHRRAWAANDWFEGNRCRKLALLCPASRAAVGEFYIVTVTESPIGELHMDSWVGAKATLISFSKWRSRQEVMLAMQPLLGFAAQPENVTRW
jgi:hypothetical protein